MAESRKRGLIEQAVRRDLRRLRSEARRSALAESALTLARTLDRGVEVKEIDPETGEPVERRISPRDMATLIRELRMTMQELSLERATTGTGDTIDELSARRAARLGA